jgi:hypothetical protein
VGTLPISETRGTCGCATSACDPSRPQAQTPNGSRTDRFTVPSPIGMVSPLSSVTRPAKNSHCATAVLTSRAISRTGLPQFAASSIASSSACARIFPATCFMSAARSSGFTARHVL